MLSRTLRFAHPALQRHIAPLPFLTQQHLFHMASRVHNTPGPCRHVFQPTLHVALSREASAPGRCSLHTGQDSSRGEAASHVVTHNVWNRWQHGSSVTTSSRHQASKQMAHVGEREDCKFCRGRGRAACSGLVSHGPFLIYHRVLIQPRGRHANGGLLLSRANRVVFRCPRSLVQIAPADATCWVNCSARGGSQPPLHLR